MSTGLHKIPTIEFRLNKLINNGKVEQARAYLEVIKRRYAMQISREEMNRRRAGQMTQADIEKERLRLLIKVDAQIESLRKIQRENPNMSQSELEAFNTAMVSIRRIMGHHDGVENR